MTFSQHVAAMELAFIRPVDRCQRDSFLNPIVRRQTRDPFATIDKGELIVSNQIGERIRQARLLANLTQKELAGRVQCSRNHVSEIERNVCKPSLVLWLRIQRVLKL
jgi:DNA-binding XRE family transcriptional regulator